MIHNISRALYNGLKKVKAVQSKCSHCDCDGKMQSALSIHGRKKMKASWNYSFVCVFFKKAGKQCNPGSEKDSMWNVLEDLDFLILCDNSIIKHDRSFRLKVGLVAISSEIHFFVTVNIGSLNEFITVWQDMAACIWVALTAWFISG